MHLDVNAHFKGITATLTGLQLPLHDLVCLDAVSLRDLVRDPAKKRDAAAKISPKHPRISQNILQQV